MKRGLEDNDIDQYEMDQEIPLPDPEERECKFLKTKAVILTDDIDDPEIEIKADRDGVHFTFTTRQEFTTEKTVECDLGHKHRQVVKKDFTYETLRINRKQARNLVTWLKARV